VACEDESHDRTSIAVPGKQADLAAALKATGTPLICVLIHGGSLALGSLLENCDAILDAFFPGVQGGVAVVNGLFGVVNPGGRTPQTWYIDDSVLPMPGDMDLYRSRLTYRFVADQNVAIPFGHGLSYTTFEYGNMSHSTSVTACETINVNVSVSNIGSFVGDEVVQLFVEQLDASVPVPTMQLADFQRITLAPGEQRQVQLSVQPRWHAAIIESSYGDFWRPTTEVQAGHLRIYLGGYGQYSKLTSEVTITSTADLDRCRDKSEPSVAVV